MDCGFLICTHPESAQLTQILQGNPEIRDYPIRNHEGHEVHPVGFLYLNTRFNNLVLVYVQNHSKLVELVGSLRSATARTELN